jgi:hypothetical protein
MKATVGSQKQFDELRSLDLDERDAVQAFRRRRCVALVQHHSPEEIIVVEVLTDNHHHAAFEAKNGRVVVARAEMQALDAMPLSDDPEIQSVYDLSALPVWGLIRWLEGYPKEAIELMHGALRVSVELTIRFGHDYLTSKRIHLAANIGRVLVSLGECAEALDLVGSLRAVVAGDRSKWPYESHESLDVPLEGSERRVIEYQLARIGSLMNSAEQPRPEDSGTSTAPEPSDWEKPEDGAISE